MQRLAEIPFPEVERVACSGRALVILPVGVVEEHGAHLPLGLDSFAAEVYAEAAQAFDRAIIPARLAGVDWLDVPHHGSKHNVNPRVLDRDAYWQAVKTELEKQGVCTIIEKEELAVKITNTYNEQWNLYTSVGFVRRKYVTTCEPSWF